MSQLCNAQATKLVLGFARAQPNLQLLRGAIREVGCVRNAPAALNPTFRISFYNI